jgi:NADH-quinone oxidoreductase subunit A
MLFIDYLNFLLFLFITLILISVSLLINYLMKKELTYEKISSYECGFDAFSESRDPFDIKFYLIAILFIIFDIEVIFFFPWLLSLNDLFYYGYIINIIFIIILIIGFAYEYRKQCLDFI